MEGKPTIGWIGTGVMGFHMCKHLISKGYSLSVFNRTASKADGLLEMGAKWVEPKLIAESCDIVILMLGYPRDVQAMCLGEQKILNHMKKGSILIDHTTSKPNLAFEIHREGSQKGISCIDAPVSGGDIGAKEARLVTMCGGDKQAFEKVRPILQCYSRSIQLFGSAGKGQHNKMVNQIILAGNMAGMAEGLLYASKMGLDLKQSIELISQGAANSTALKVLGTRAVEGNFDPGFYVEHYIKDMQIALQEASRASLCLPCLSLVKQLFLALKAQGGQRLGTQALVKVLQQMNNHKLG